MTCFFLKLLNFFTLEISSCLFYLRDKCPELSDGVLVVEDDLHSGLLVPLQLPDFGLPQVDLFAQLQLHFPRIFLAHTDQ